jgi:two-component system chemotaxis sensor kinase CheA
VVVKGLPAGTPSLRFVAGVTNLADGRLVTVLDPGQIIEKALSQHSPAPGSVVSPTRPTVLVVDDSVTSRTMVAELLEQSGYRALTAHDGENALAVLRGQQVALVVSDVEMPNIDGYGLVRRIRSSPDTANIPVILVTSLGDAGDRARGAAAGANAYIVKKDFDPEAFLSIISEQLEHHTQR